MKPNFRVKEFSALWDRVNREWPTQLDAAELALQGREWCDELGKFRLDVVERALLELRRTFSGYRPRLSDWLRACNETARAIGNVYAPPPELENVTPMTQAEKDGWRATLRAAGVPERHATTHHTSATAREKDPTWASTVNGVANGA